MKPGRPKENRRTITRSITIDPDLLGRLKVEADREGFRSFSAYLEHILKTLLDGVGPNRGSARGPLISQYIRELKANAGDL